MDSTYIRRAFLAAGAAAALLLTAAFAVACDDDDGDGGSEADVQAVEAAARQVAGYGPDDVDAFLEVITDDVLENFFGYTRDECRANAAECVGEPSAVLALTNTEVSGDEASTDIELEFGSFHLSFVREDDVWKLDGIRPVAAEIPEGVKAVALELDEFSFAFDESEITDSNFAFEVENAGEQAHEVAVARVAAGADLVEVAQAILESGLDEEPEGIDFVNFVGPLAAGTESTLVFAGQLSAGRYALLCFLPDTDDPEGTPHALKGMVSEFTIE